MAAWDITAYEYDIPMEKLLHRRLEGHAYAVEVLPCGARVKLSGTGAAAVLADALTKVILRDLQYFVLARMTDAMPLALADKRQVLTDALYTARNREDEGPVRGELVRFLTAERALCLDGFLCFRMPETLMLWQLCVEQAASKVLLQKTVELIATKGYRVGNIDATVCAERPKLKAHIPEMQECMARVMGIDADCVSIKATTSEKLGFTGREEGMSAYATVLIQKDPLNLP